MNFRSPLAITVLAVVALFCSGARAADPIPGPLRIVIVGDSTVCNYPANKPDRGWGMFIEEYFKSGSVKVINLAAAGRSTKTFIQEGRWQKALDEKPQYVLIQFGHNDSHEAGRPEATDAATDYKVYLRRYVGESRGIGATPILITPMVRRIFTSDGKLKDILQPYADAMKAVGIEKKTAVIDLHASSYRLVEGLGREKSAEMANQPGDVTHFNEQGARAMANLIMQELPGAEPRLAEYLKPAAINPVQADLIKPKTQFLQLAGKQIANGDFEHGLEGWTIGANEGMSVVSSEQAASGKNSIKVVDDDDKRGSDVLSAPVAISGGGQYVLKGQVYAVSGSGLGIYVQMRDRDGREVGDKTQLQRAAPSRPAGQWIPFSLNIAAPETAATLQVWIHSYAPAKVTAYLDDFVLSTAGPEALLPPFPGSYKIRPNETSKLTAADVVGPDGIVYPDWTYAGKPGGIPAVNASARVEDFGAYPDDGKDDSDALEQGANTVGARGGGALLLGAGTYNLNRPIRITHDNVVLRGAGSNRTKVIFQYSVPAGEVGFLQPKPNAVLTPFTWIEAHAAPRDLQQLTILVDDVLIRQEKHTPHWGATFSSRASGAAITGKLPDGAHWLRVVAEYPGGKKLESKIPVTMDSKAGDGEARVPAQIGAIMFCGRSNYGPQLMLASDGKRGDRQVRLQSAEGLQPGDRVRMLAPATPRWNALVRNASPQGIFRRYEFLVQAVEGNTLRLNQPLRIDFPVVDGSYVQEIFPIRNCGVEDFSLEQTQPLWTSGIIFSNAWECWARGVVVKKAGRFPLYMLNAKWGEIRDCTFDDAWYKDGGGTGYVGWEVSSDCLMENVTTYNLRHAPLVQWSASGNVIRKGVFHDSDAQWHSGWTNENLFEQCIVESKLGNGGYGYGMWASPPEDDAHGPNGPRNVVYNCDVSSPKAGLWMGGMNENWLILYNRFIVGSGPGIYAKTASFDHIVKGNVFALEDAKQPAVFLATPDCIGIEVTENRVLGGNGEISGGAAPMLMERGNTFGQLNGVQADDPKTFVRAPRPQPAVPSIFEWQRGARP